MINFIVLLLKFFFHIKFTIRIYNRSRVTKIPLALPLDKLTYPIEERMNYTNHKLLFCGGVIRKCMSSEYTLN